MQLSRMPSSETQRVKLVQNVFARSITNVSKPVDAQTLAEAFPYADEKMLEALAIQTKNLVTHYANGRWKEFAEAASFEELCKQFDHLEREAIERIQAGVKPAIITRDPKLSIPPLLLKTLDNLETLSINEIERLEADFKNRTQQIQSTAEEWGKVLP
ncbi:hypothetical protein PSHT_14424 [Puccinia striiformis]|uniref:Uncharacterized protein n=1 Tax=Puccinia striiformis TaxID=27350 RepID=A0A2S4UK27_9BASI|nr:hypothetical protein PSHT_14424 [Puccinia striiformis]